MTRERLLTRKRGEITKKVFRPINVRRSRLSGEKTTGVRVRLTRCHANNARTLYVSTHLDAYLLVKARFDNPRIRGQYGRLLYPEDDEKSPSVTVDVSPNEEPRGCTGNSFEQRRFVNEAISFHAKAQ